MFEETDKIIEKVVKSNLFDVQEVATIERALKFSEMYDIMLNECLFKQTDAKTNIFDFKYQVGQVFGKVKHKGHCSDCIECLKTVSYDPKTQNKIVKYTCGLHSKDTYEYNSCEYFKDFNDC